MSITARMSRLLLAKQSLLAKNAVEQRCLAHTIDFKPGPFPRTKEQREAAARKYNLLPEDYEPYPEEEGFGDYPKLTWVHNESRPRSYDFDYYYARRNYGEPLHTEHLYTTQEKPNFNLRFQKPWYVMLGQLLGTIGGLALLAYFSNHTRVVYPKKPKQYPGEYFDFGPKDHYTFESEK